MNQRKVLRIAHAYGNRPERLAEALAGPVDLIEADVWYGGGNFWVRHERKIWRLPLLIDKRHNIFDSRRAGDLPVFGWQIRRDLKLRFEKLLEALKDRRGLVLDFKGEYSLADQVALSERLQPLLAEYGLVDKTIICGQNWGMLDTVRRTAPELDVRDTIGHIRQWEPFLSRLERGLSAPAITISHRLLRPAEAQVLQQKGVSYICWTVDDPKDLARILPLGPAGITSNSLELLASLESIVA